jgi:hypothetical protein
MKVWVHITPVYFTGSYFRVYYLIYTIKLTAMKLEYLRLRRVYYAPF